MGQSLGLKSPGLESSWLKNPGLESSWLKSPGLKGVGLKLGVEKSGVEMSFNHVWYITRKDLRNGVEYIVHYMD